MNPGTYEVVVSCSQHLGTGAYTGSIEGPLPAIQNPPRPLTFISQPLDVTARPGGTPALEVAVDGADPITFQWFQGQSGDISQPVAGATARIFNTPPLNEDTNYWVRIMNGGEEQNSRTATVFIVDGTIEYSDELDALSHTFLRPASVGNPGSVQVPYKVFPFRVSVSGNYTFQISSPDFRPRVIGYGSSFPVDSPLVNLGGIYNSPGSNTYSFSQGFLSSPGEQYLIVTAENPSLFGSFSLSMTGAPGDSLITALVPKITSQPVHVEMNQLGETASFSFAGTGYTSAQWFSGPVDDLDQMSQMSPIPEAVAEDHDTGPIDENTAFLARVTNQYQAYVETDVALAGIKPSGMPDIFHADEDQNELLSRDAILANDTLVSSSTPLLIIDSQPSNGTVTGSPSSGDLTYQPDDDFVGSDQFTYRIQQGFMSDPILVTVTVAPVNDPPIQSAGSIEDFVLENQSQDAPELTLGLGFRPGGGSDEDNQRLTFKVLEIPPLQLGSIMGGALNSAAKPGDVIRESDFGRLVFQPSGTTDWGQGYFSFEVTDNGLTGSQPDPLSIQRTMLIRVLRPQGEAHGFVRNGGFELDPDLVDWTSSDASIVVDDDRDVPIEGSRNAAILRGNFLPRSVLGQQVNVIPGVKHRIGFQFGINAERSSNQCLVLGNPSQLLLFQVFDRGQSVVRSNLERSICSGLSWAQETLEFTPSGDEVDLSFSCLTTDAEDIRDSDWLLDQVTVFPVRDYETTVARLDPALRDPNLDPDRDGENNEAEHLAGTDAGDPQSVQANSGTEMQWLAVTDCNPHPVYVIPWSYVEVEDRIYHVDLTTDLQRWETILSIRPFLDPTANCAFVVQNNGTENREILVVPPRQAVEKFGRAFLNVKSEVLDIP